MTQGCDSFRRLVSAYLDGELVGEDRSAFEEHVSGCDACRRSLEDERDVVQAVQRALPLYEAPPELRTRVDRLFTAAPRRRTWRAAAAAIAAAAAALIVAAGLLFYRIEPPAARRALNDFAALAVDTHLRHAREQLPLEVRSEAPAEVSRFFSGRVPFQLTLPEYPLRQGETKPYRLEGGRLVAFGGDYTAFVAYRMDGRPISLLVTSLDRVRPEGGSEVASGALTFHIHTVSGLKVITWSDNGLTYALVSDVAVSGSRSCVVCHGGDAERRKLEGL